MNVCQQGDVLKSTGVFVNPPTGGLIVWYWRVTVMTGQPATDFDVANQLDVAFGVMFKGVINNKWTWKGFQVQIIRGGQRFLMTQSSGATAGLGTLVGDQLPDHLASLMRFGNNLAGKKNRGRTYLPPGDETTNTATAIIENSQSQRLQLIASTRAAPVGIIGAGGGLLDMTPVIYNRETGTTRDITSWQVAQVYHVQRRRAVYTRPFSSPWVNIP